MTIKKGGLSRRPKSAEVSYRKQLYTLVRDMEKEVRNKILPELRAYNPPKSSKFESPIIDHEIKALRDSTIDNLGRIVDELISQYSAITKPARKVANQFTRQVDKENKKRFARSMQSLMGVSYEGIAKNEGITDTLKLSVKRNVKLIKSIPSNYFDRIETIVYNGVITGNSSKSMIEEIRELGQSTYSRAKTIARDQTSKLTSELTQVRQQSAGIESYIWVTVGDGNRVRPSHRQNNGKVFRWDKPPSETGHPGNDINCRCIAQPIINIG